MKKRSGIRKFTLITAISVLLICLTGAFIALGINRAFDKGGLGGVSGGSQNDKYAAADAPSLPSTEEYEKIFVLKAGMTNAEKAALWDKAVAVTTGKVLFVMEDDWVADNTGIHDFGTTTAVDSEGVHLGSLLVPAGVDMTLDMRGHKLDRQLTDWLTGNDNWQGEVIKVKGKLTLTGNGVITGGYNDAQGGGINITASGTLTMYSGTIKGNTAAYGGGIGLSNGATVIMYGGLITENIADDTCDISMGGGVSLANGAVFEMYGGQISKNTSRQGGGVAIRAPISPYTNNVNNIVDPGTGDPSTFKMYGGIIGGDTAADGNVTTAVSSANVNNGAGGGTGVLAMMRSKVEMYGGKISNNKANGTYQGSGVKATIGSSFTMNGGTISSNVNAYCGGGGVLIANNSKFVLLDGIIENNRADVPAASGDSCSGGGININTSDCTFEMYGGIIRGNYANGYGGGIAFPQTSYTAYPYFEDGIITGNTTELMGGGIYTAGFSTTSSPVKVLNLSGPLICAGNFVKDGANYDYENNLHLRRGAKIGLVRYDTSYTGARLYKDGRAANIGITYGGKVDVTAQSNNGTNISKLWYFTMGQVPDNSFAYFFYDEEGYYINHQINLTGSVAGYNRLPYIAKYPDAPNANQAKWEINTEVKWEYQLDGGPDWIPANSNGEVRVYDGKAVTNVRCTHTYTHDGTVTVYEFGDANNKIFYGFDGFDTNTGFNSTNETWPAGGIKDVGEYSFTVDTTNAGFAYSWLRNMFLRIKIVPADVTVDLGSYSGRVYGEAFKYDNVTLNGGAPLTEAEISALGVQINKPYGTGVGTYDVVGSVNKTNHDKNYNISFINGTYEVVARDVYVIINNDSAAYGKTKDMNTEIETKLNTTPVTENGKQRYEGGWRYGKQPDGSDSLIFHPDDLTTSKSPFKLISQQIKDAEKASSSGYAPVVYDNTAGAEDLSTQTGKPVAGYNIIADEDSLNVNYDIHFIHWNDDPDSTDLGTADTTKSYGTFTVKEAEITVKKSTVTNDYSETIAFKDLPAAGKKVELPHANVTIKGDQSATAVYTYLEKPDTTKPENKDWVAPDGTNFFDAKYSWAAESSMQAKKTAGTYVVYFKISVPNHAVKIQVWTLSITAADLMYKFKAESVMTVDGVETRTELTDTPIESEYEKNTVIEISALKTDGSALPSDAKYKVYYLSTDADGKHGKWDAAVDQNPADADDKISIVDANKHKDYGTTEKPVNAGEYKATLVTDPGGN